MKDRELYWYLLGLKSPWTVRQVSLDIKVPMVPNFGQQPRFIVTIQPSGVKFDPPAHVTHPNVDGLVPGEVTELYSFDHDMGSFVAIGTATVSADGTMLVADPGMGILKGGWHCGGNPQPTGCCEDEDSCGTGDACYTVSGSKCKGGCKTTCNSRPQPCPDSGNKCQKVTGTIDACGCGPSSCQTTCQPDPQPCDPAPDKCTIVTGQKDACGCGPSTCQTEQVVCPQNVCLGNRLVFNTCDPKQGCIEVNSISCDDGKSCTIDACDSGIKDCTHVPTRDCEAELGQCDIDAQATFTSCASNGADACLLLLRPDLVEACERTVMLGCADVLGVLEAACLIKYTACLVNCGRF